MREVECLYNMSELTVRIDGNLQPVDTDYPCIDQWAETSAYLEEAIENGERPLVVLMFDEGAVVAEVTRFNMSPLELDEVEFNEDNPDENMEKMSREGTIGLKPSDDTAPLDDLLRQFISWDRYADFVKAVDRRGADVPLNALLMDAANYDRVEYAKLLLERGANVNFANANGWTPLHVAAAHGLVPFLRLLLDAGATQSPDRSGETPLMAAQREGQVEAAQILST